MTDSDRPTDPVPEPALVDHVHVLMVDDDPEAGFLLEAQLPRNLANLVTITQVRSLSGAFHHFESGCDCDVVLLDLGLPGSKGRETLTKFKAHAPELPIIVFTNTDDDALKSQLEDEGAHSYVVKGQVPARELIANVVLEVGSHRANTGYSERPNEVEVFRRKSRAAVELSRAMSLPPGTPEADKATQRAQAQMALVGAHESTLLYGRMDDIARGVAKLSEASALTGERVKVIDERSRDNAKAIKEIKSSRYRDKLETLQEKATERKLFSKESFAAVGAVVVAIISAITAWLMRGKG